jgi:hypothetical protein
MVRFTDLNTSLGRCVFIVARPNTFVPYAMSVTFPLEWPFETTGVNPFAATDSARLAVMGGSW